MKSVIMMACAMMFGCALGNEAGPVGADGKPGAACWDLNLDGQGNLPDEDKNADAVVDVLDCQGLPGQQGIPGDKGATGDKGDPGPTGATGATGAQGEKGMDGADGQPGAKGDTGAQGPQGEPGTVLPECSADADCPDLPGCFDSDLTVVVEQACSNGKCVWSNISGENGELCDFGCIKGVCVPECSSSSQCGSGQVCDNGQCVTIPAPLVCNDNVGCTIDTNVSGVCTYTPNHASCDDGNLATTDTCTLTGCTHTAVVPQSCNDGIACTTDVLVNGQCTYTVHNEVCDDGNPATTDSCDQTKGCVNNPVGEHDVVVQCDVGFPCEVHLWAQPDLNKGYTGNDILDKSGTAPAVYGLSQAQVGGSGIKIKIRWLTQNASGQWLAMGWSGDAGQASMLDHVKVWVDGVLKQAPGAGQPKLPLEAVLGQTNTEGNWIVATNQFKP